MIDDENINTYLDGFQLESGFFFERFEHVHVVLSGLAVGIVLIVALRGAPSAMLFGVSSTDLPTIILSVSLLVAVSGLSAYVPAWRASRVDPMIALRYE